MVTKELITNCLRTSFDDIPEKVRTHGKRSLLNWLGVTIGAAQHPSIDMLIELSSDLESSKQATVFGRENKVDLLMAALINGTASHIYDYDDTHLDTIHHPSGPVAPVVLALGEHLDLNGEDVLRAFILGCEAELRISNAVYPSHYELGWHITGTTGVFGATIAAGILLDLSEDKFLHAIGLAGTQSSGLRESFGTMAKPFHPGKAAQNGLLSALLADKGFTGSKQIIEAQRGFAHVLSPDHDLEQVNVGWGSTWELLKNSFKPYACGIVLHPSIDACIYLQGKTTIENLEYIELRVHPYVLELTGKRRPQTGLEGKFSIYFAGAVAFLEGEAGFKQFTDEKVTQKNMIQMQNKIKVEIDDRIKEDEVVATAILQSGEVIQHKVEHARGSISNPLTEEDLIRKFNELAEDDLDCSQRNAITQHILNIDKLSTVNEIMRSTRITTQ